jgi:hypothetical protein
MEALYQLFIDLKKTYDSLKRGLVYSILIEFAVLMKQVWLIVFLSKMV